jgi:RHS repeat-associated protein
VNTSGNALDHIRYSAFGRVTAETNPSNGDRFKFTGRDHDSESGLHYYRARYVEPAAGRFISLDPWGFNAGDPNLFRYVANSPVDAVDPSGLPEKVARS